MELLSVVLDVRQWEAAPKGSRGDQPDTGAPLLDCSHCSIALPSISLSLIALSSVALSSIALSIRVFVLVVVS